MNKYNLLTIAISILIFSVTAQANAPKNSTFIKLSETQQHWWYVGVYTVLGHVVSLNDDGQQAECVWNWFFNNADKRKAQLLKSFTAYPDHTPTSIVIALLRRDCGVFLETAEVK